MPHIHPDFLLSSYTYELPEDRIAQQPALERAASRLMLLDRRSGVAQCALFADILSYLPENALLVANNSRVVPARLTGTRPGGAKVELLLLTPPPLLQAQAKERSLQQGFCQAEAEMLLRPAKKIRPGDRILIDDTLSAELLQHGPFGRGRVRLAWRGALQDILERCGSMPLPPYIKRPQTPSGQKAPAQTPAPWGSDAERYQTTYASAEKAGSVAAPTAGLHFSPELLCALRESGREWADLTLYVGYGTFSPVRCEDIREHSMHAEYVEISEDCAAAVCKAKAEGRPILAVGTTSARSLEGAFAQQHGLQENHNMAAGHVFPKEAVASNAASVPGKAFLAPFGGWTDIFLYPGKEFHVIDGLITNFHLPESSLLMLVSALAGRKATLAAYKQALAADFRFFSYGDAMLIV